MQTEEWLVYNAVLIIVTVSGSYLHERFLGLKPKTFHSAAFVALCAVALLLGGLYAAHRSAAAGLSVVALYWPLMAAAYKRDYHISWGLAYSCPLPSLLNLLGGTLVAGLINAPY